MSEMAPGGIWEKEEWLKVGSKKYDMANIPAQRLFMVGDYWNEHLEDAVTSQKKFRELSGKAACLLMQKDLSYLVERYGFFRGLKKWVDLAFLSHKKIARKLGLDAYSEWSASMLDKIGVSKKKAEAQKTMEKVMENLVEKVGSAEELSNWLLNALQYQDGQKHRS